MPGASLPTGPGKKKLQTLAEAKKSAPTPKSAQKTTSSAPSQRGNPVAGKEPYMGAQHPTSKVSRTSRAVSAVKDSKAGKVATKAAGTKAGSKLIKLAKGKTVQSMLILGGAEQIIRHIPGPSGPGKAVPNYTGGKGATVGWKADKKKTDMGKNPIQKGTFKDPNKPAASTKYRVETGDTLSGIAKRAGVTLAELRAANPQLKGKGIFRNTGVNIPSKGKKPSPEYTGPVPFRPGSAAAKAYEAKRKKK